MDKEYKEYTETRFVGNLLSNSRLLELQSILEKTSVLNKHHTDNLDINFWENLEKRYPTHYVSAFRQLHTSGVEFDSKCFDKDSVQSNIWLVEELKKIKIPLGTVFLCAGWYATLAVLMFEHSIDFKKIRNFDIDPNALSISEVFNKPWVVDNWKFKSSVGDIADIDYNTHIYDVLRSNGTLCNLTDNVDTVINVNCEFTQHSFRWFNRIQKDTLVILQASDRNTGNQAHYFNNLPDFIRTFPIHNILYCEEKKLDNCTKYMIIGFK